MDLPEEWSEEAKKSINDFIKVLSGEMTIDEFTSRNPEAFIVGAVEIKDGEIVRDISDDFVGSTPALDELLKDNNITKDEDVD